MDRIIEKQDTDNGVIRGLGVADAEAIKDSGAVLKEAYDMGKSVQQ